MDNININLNLFSGFGLDAFADPDLFKEDSKSNRKSGDRNTFLAVETENGKEKKLVKLQKSDLSFWNWITSFFYSKSPLMNKKYRLKNVVHFTKEKINEALEKADKEDSDCKNITNISEKINYLKNKGALNENDIKILKNIYRIANRAYTHDRDNDGLFKFLAMIDSEEFNQTNILPINSNKTESNDQLTEEISYLDVSLQQTISLSEKQIKELLEIGKDLSSDEKLDYFSLKANELINKLQQMEPGDRLEGIEKLCVLDERIAQLLISRFSQLDLQELTQEQKISLYQKLVDAGNQAAYLFFKKPPSLEEFEPQKRIDLFKYVTSKCIDKITEAEHLYGVQRSIGPMEAEILSKFEFVNDFKKCESLPLQLEFIQKLSQLDDRFLSYLPCNQEFQEVLKEMPFDERMQICNKLAETGEETKRMLSDNCPQLGIVRDFNVLNYNSSTIPFRLEKINALQEWALVGLLSSPHYILPYIKEKKDKFLLCQIIASNGQKAAEVFSQKMKSLELYKNFNALTSKQERFEFIQELSKINPVLVKGFCDADSYDLNISELPSEEKFALCELLVSKGKSTEGLAGAFRKFKFDEDFKALNKVEERIKLFKRLLSWGEDMIRPLLSNLKEIKLDDLDPSLRFSFCEYILEQGGDITGENFLIYNSEINLSLLDVKSRIKLCRQLLGKGTLTLRQLELRLEKFLEGDLSSIKEVDQEEIIALIEHGYQKGEKGPSIIKTLFSKNSPSFFNAISDPQRRLRVLLELQLYSPSQTDEIKNINEFELGNLKVLLKNTEQSEYLNVLTVLWPFFQDQSIKPYSQQDIEKFQELISKPPLKRFLHYFKEIQNKDPYVQRSLIRWLAYTCGIFLDSKELIVDQTLIEYANEKTEQFSKNLENLPVTKAVQFLERQKCKHLIPQDYEKNPQLLRKPLYKMGVLNLPQEESHSIEADNMCELTYDYRNPTLRLALITHFDTVKKLLGRPSTRESKSLRCVEDFSRLLISKWVELGLEEKDGLSLLKIIVEKSALFKDTKKLDNLLLFLLEVVNQYHPKKEDIRMNYQVLLKILKNDEQPNANLSALKSVKIICGREKSQIFMRDFVDDKKTIEKSFAEYFQECFDIKNIPNLSESYDETFGSFRNPMALFIYLASVNKLFGQEKQKVFNCLKKYVEAVLQRKFPSIRYETKDHPHLEKVFENNLGIKNIWTKRKPLTTLEISQELSEKKIDHKKFLLEKIGEKHIQNTPVLQDYLEGKLSLKEAKEKLSENSGTSDFQLLAIDLCDEKIQVKTFIDKIMDLQKKKKYDLGEFENDLKVLLPQKKKAGEYQIGLADNYGDLLLIGTEVNGSCQHIGGDVRLNKCLVGYLMDGSVLPIVVKKNGVIIARSILRLLWDEKNNTPVLFQERLYSNVNNTLISDAINKAACDMAKDMKIPLLTREIESPNKKPYNGIVKFLGGNTPFIYSDASSGVLNGLDPFTFPNCDEIIV